MMKKNFIRTAMISILSVAFIASMAGCGAGSSSKQASSSSSSSSSTSKTYTIGVLTANLPDPFYVSIYYGMVHEAKKLGDVKLVLMDAGGYSNVSKQVNQIDEMVADKVDAIDLAATSPTGTKSAVNRAVKAGIPVIGFASATQGNMAFYVASSQQQLGDDQAKYMAKTLNGHGNVVMINGPAGVSWSVLRAKAFKDYITKNDPGIHILAEKWGPSDRTTGMTSMENLLQTFSNIDGVYTGSDANGDGAAAALVAAHKVGKLVLTTAVMEPDTVTYIKKGVISMTAAQRCVTIGETTVLNTVKYLKKEKVNYQADAEFARHVIVPDVVVTKDNISSVDLSTIQSPAGFKP